MKTILLCLFITLSFASYAEVYRWIDKEGKVRYSDSKPKTAAEDITAKVKKQNIDTSTQEHEKLESLFRKENAADRDYKQQQSQTSPEQQQRCLSAKQYLGAIDGRVQFLDNKGKMVNVTEAERKKRVTEAQQYIQKNCKP